MNISDKKNIDKFLAIILIMLLTISDFLFVGKNLVSYALDVVNTNNENVEFMAYFLSETNERLDKIEKNIDEGAKLYIDVSVKQEGYFNGKITINNSNFNLKQQENNEYISEMTSNTVTLKQINAGSTITLELEIEPEAHDSVNIQALASKTSVVLEGSYVNSKNIEKNKFVEITGTDSVEVDWKSSNETKAELEATVLTNSVYKVNDEEKRVVQILVNSKITANNYPVKSTEVVLSAPKNVQEVKAHTRSTNATNSNINFDENNFTYSNQNNTVTINLQNEDTGNISWNKNAQDTIVVTYILSKEENLENKDITVNSRIKTYDDKDLTADQNVHIEKEIDGIVSYSIENAEDAIYKGKIYTKEERDYTVKNTINVDYLNVLDNITIKEKESVYIANEKEENANIVYKETKINKEEFLKIFGEEGYITVKKAEGIVLANINKDTETDENGKIVINYQEGTKSIELVTSKPVNLGILNIENTKTIQDSNLEREKIATLTGIQESLAINNIESSKIITLKDTETTAQLNINTKKLLSTDKNENVKMKVILGNNSEDKDLYKNPSIKITLPQQVTKVSAKCKLLYGNGLELANAKVIEENGKQVINIELAGEQTSYNKDAIEGTTIIIYATIEVNKLAVNSEEEIVLNYTNELATNYADNGEQSKKVKIVGHEGIITTNNIEEYEIETIGNQGTKNVELEVSKQAKEATISISAINNEGTDLNNVSILGSFPTGESNTLGAKLTSGINIVSNTQNAKIYYSDNETPTTDLNDSENGWTTTKNSNTNKSYLITLDNMQTGEQVEANYTINIPENLKYKLRAQEGYTVNYTNTLTEALKTEKATTLELSTGAGAEIQSTLKAYVGGEELENGSTVNSGEIVTYEVTLENTGDKVVNNINIEANIPEETKYIKFVKETTGDSNVITSKRVEDTYQEIELENNTITNQISSLEVGKKEIFIYDLKVGEDTQDGTEIQNNIKIMYEGIEETKTIKNNVAKSDISLNLFMFNRYTTELKAGDTNRYCLQVKNLTDEDISNLNINLEYNDLFKINEVSMMNRESKLKDIEINSENATFILEELKANETIEICIYTTINEAKQSGIGNLSSIASYQNRKYHSYKITEPITQFNVSITLESDKSGKSVKTGEGINYNIKVTNTGDTPIQNLTVEQQISDQFEVNKVTIAGKEVEYSKSGILSGEVLKNAYGLRINTSLNINETIDIQVETNNEINNTEEIELVSVAEAFLGSKSLARTEEVKHTLEAYTEPTYPDYENEDEDNSDEDKKDEDKKDEQGKNDEEKKDEENKNDENKKDNEDKSDGNDNDGNAVNPSKTNENDSTDTDLEENKSFDLELSKTISKVSISNAEGNKTQEYNNANLAKVEIKAKYLKGTIVAIEYKIKVTNNGEIAGYAKNIVDYKPADLSFNSSLNPDWYQSGEYLYTSSLANTKIEPGESKELTLVLTKTMTETNTGLVNNMAEIYEDSNPQGISDKDSTPANRETSEDDLGSANVIISISTGAVIRYIATILSIIIIIGIGYYIVSKKIIDGNNIKF